MNIHRNFLTIVASAMLVASLPAGAQVLGGGVAGTAGGALGGGLGGGLGPQGLGGGGNAGASGHGGFDGAGTLGTMRDRSQQIGGRTREVTGNAAGAVRSRAETARGKTAATADTAQAAGASANREAAEAAPQPASPQPPSLQPDDSLVFDGGGSAGAEKHAMGHGITAVGSADSQGSADRSGVRYSGNGKADMGVKKDEPATAPAQ